MNQAITEELNEWIKEHGCERDALNVAITRLRLAEAEIESLKGRIDALSDILECTGPGDDCQWAPPAL